MPSTHLSLNYHLVFATKDHTPSISRTWRDRLHGFLGGCVRTEGGIALSVGGVSDHVHILAGLKATHCLADVLRNIKSASSRWVHEEIGIKPFAWQEGYGAFTVSMSQLHTVRAYIENQEEHHRTKTFREEYIGFLERHGIDLEYV